MARFLLLTWDGSGNQPPAIALAQELKSRGHEPVFAGYEDQRALIEGRGFELTALERSSAALRAAGPGLEQTIGAIWVTPDHLADVPEAVARARADALIVDCMMFGALAAAEKLDMPVANFVHNPPGSAFAPGAPVEDIILQPTNEIRKAAGLVPVASAWEAWAKLPTFACTIRELDPLAGKAPAAFAYDGPFFERVAPSLWQSPWAQEDERPLVLVSCHQGPGWDQTSRIQRALDGLAGLHCRVLVTAGPTDIASLKAPANAALVRRLPHMEIMPKVSAIITHAGHGTVCAALAHGVPIVALPNAQSDQPVNAAQLARLGAGIALDGDAATAGEIGDAVFELLTRPAYKAAANGLAAAIARAPGVGGAARRLEASL